MQKSDGGLLRTAKRIEGRHRRALGGTLVMLALSAVCADIAVAAPATSPPARISIVIDDLGNNLAAGRRVIALPAPITLAILPHAAHSTRLANEARQARKEVLLHLPMQPLGDADPGPGVIATDMPAREISMTLDVDLHSVPHAIGVNNHMGSRLTQHEETMQQLFSALRARGLFFLDSRTGANSVAARIGQRHGVAVVVRDVFLDHDVRGDAIRARLNELVNVARRRGHAIGIGHPNKQTLAALEAWLAHTPQNIQVAPLSELVQSTQEARHGARASAAGAGL